MLHTYCANEFLKFIIAKNQSISNNGVCYIGFSTAHKPTADGSTFSEPTGYGSYKRKLLSTTINFDIVSYLSAPSGGKVENIAAFCSPQCLDEGGWPEFTHFGIFDAETGGHLLASDVLRDPTGELDENGLYPATTIKVEYNQVAVFAEGALQLTLK